MLTPIAADRPGDERGPGSGERAEPQATRTESEHGLQLFFGGRQPAEDLVGVTGQKVAGVGQRRTARAPLDKPDADFALDRRGGREIADGV